MLFSAQAIPEPTYEEGDNLPPGQYPSADIQAARDAALEANRLVTSPAARATGPRG